MVSFAMATASCSFCAGITLSTGPKISSCAMVEELSTLPKTVGSMNQPRSRCLGRPPPVGDQGAHVGLGVEGVADLDLGEDAGQGVDELVVAVLTDDDPRQRGAD